MASSTTDITTVQNEQPDLEPARHCARDRWTHSPELVEGSVVDHSSDTSLLQHKHRLVFIFDLGSNSDDEMLRII